MQLRCLHADAFSFEVRDHDPDSEARSGQSADLDGAIVVFVAVEAADADSPTRVADAAADRIAEMGDRLGEETAALVPCAQLTDSPAAKSVAGDVLDDLAAELGIETHAVPLGESVSFELDARGHPFANQRFEIEPAETRAGEWFRLEADGSLIETADDTERPALDDGQMVPTMSTDRLMTASEGGPMLFGEDGTVLPEGVFVRDLVVDLATDRLREYGALPVGSSGSASETPFGGESLRSVFETVTEGEQSAPVLTIPVSSLADALDEAGAQIDLVSGLLADLSVPFEPVCRASESFADEHRDWLADLAGGFDRPVLLERRTENSRPLEVEFVVRGEHSQLAVPSVWIDDSDRPSDDAAVVRSQPLGNPTRFVAALCRTKGDERPQLPTWLAPVQLRLVPIAPDDIAACDRLADELAAGVRVDIDDRDLPVSDRLETADRQWIPYDAVIGPDDGQTLRVTSRAEQTEHELTPDALAERIGEETAGRPGGVRPVPRRYSDRPDALR